VILLLIKQRLYPFVLLKKDFTLFFKNYMVKTAKVMTNKKKYKY